MDPRERSGSTLSRRRLVGLAGLAAASAIGAACAALPFAPPATPTPGEATPEPPAATPPAEPAAATPATDQAPVLPPPIVAATPTLTVRQAEATGRVTIGTSQSPIEEPWFTKALSAFSARYPKVSLDQWNIRSGYLEMVASWAAAGKLPDVLFAQLRHTGALAFRKWILSLDDLVKRDAAEISPDDFHPPLAREARAGQKWLALPYDDSVGIIVYDAGALASAGKPKPSEGWTWADLATLARETTQTLREGTKARWGFRWQPEAWMLPALFRSFGAGFATDERSVKLTTDAHTRALQWLAELLAAGFAAKSTDIPADQLGIAIGRVTAEAAGSWSLARYAAVPATVQYDVQVFPRSASSPRASHSAGTGWCLTRDSRNQSAAWELIKHLSSRDTQELMISLPLRNMPSRASAMPLWTAGVKAIGMPANHSAFGIAAAEAQTAEPVAWWLEFADACDDTLPALWEGRIKAAEALAEIEQRTNAGAARYA